MMTLKQLFLPVVVLLYYLLFCLIHYSYLLQSSPDPAQYENGQKRFELNHLDGVKHGKQHYWYPNGQLEREEHFTNGVYNGKQYYWYPNGLPDREENFAEGVYIGEQLSWVKGEKTIWYPCDRSGPPLGSDADFGHGKF
jgi:antitoxin component YwqK of YwqJK toxin-antitoxin module